MNRGPSEQEVKLRKQIDEMAKLSRETKDLMLKEEVSIKSLGPDSLERLKEEELAERKQIESGMGSPVRLGDLIDRVAEAEEANKTRASSWSTWESLRLKLNNLEVRMENLRTEFNRVVKEWYAKGNRQ